MSELDPRDRIILEHAPLVAVPRYSAFSALEQSGHRYLAGDDGLYLELKRPWLHMATQIAPSAAPLPYGPVRVNGAGFEFDSEVLNLLVAQFIVDARSAMPDECAAWGVWSEDVKALLYRPCLAIAAGPGGITFHRPRLDAHEHLAVDIHSHGRLDAFFSSTDDEDDRGAVKLSIVVGHLQKKEPAVLMRLCALGHFVDFEAA